MDIPKVQQLSKISSNEAKRTLTSTFAISKSTLYDEIWLKSTELRKDKSYHECKM